MSVGKKLVAVPKGFLFSVIEAAIKKPGCKDLALLIRRKRRLCPACSPPTVSRPHQ